MSPSSFVSIIIPNYNGRPLLATCLDALNRQTHPTDRFETIVVDDASSDDSVKFLQNHYSDVHILRQLDNQGFVAACNRGVEAAIGDVLVLLNNDTEAEPGWLAGLVNTLMAHPQAGSAASKMLLFDRRDHLHSAGDLMGSDGIPINRGVWEKDEGQYDDQRWIFGPCGGAAAYRRQAWEQAGGFDPLLWMYLEDVDLAWRLQLLGWRSVFAPAARVYHHLSATGGGQLASYYVGRNTLWVIARNWPAALLRRHWRAISASQARITWDALKTWRGPASRARLRGQLAGLLGLPRILRQRRRIQRSRSISDEDLDKLLIRR